MVVKKHFRFTSSDGIHKIHGILWKPDDREIIGVLQIVHGMAEHIDRYDHFARFMCAHGFAVAGEDHLGHGYSVDSDDEYGYFGKKNGFEYVIGDNYRVKKHFEREFAEVPYFILGHSMGSFITRVFITRYSDELDGAIIMGTGHHSAPVAMFGKCLAMAAGCIKGDHYRSKFIDNMAFGSYNRKFAPARTRHDWLTKDEHIVDYFAGSRLCTFMFTVSGYKDLFDLVLNAGRGDLIDKIRKTLPLYIVSGEMDPVGAFGRGVKAVYEKYKDADIEDLTMKLYPEDRHEILNETDREVVYGDILCWLENRIKTEKGNGEQTL